MRKASEIAVGFALASVLWIGVLGWQASYAPTDSEKRRCEETATKAGHKTEECKTLWQRTTSDPVAFFTFWLVVSTVGLGASTVLLWRAGEKQLRHARRSVAIQSRDMRASIETSHRAAKAAEDSVLINRQIGESQVRAYLSCEGGTYTAAEDYLMSIARVRNHGQSPAIWTELSSQVFMENTNGYTHSENVIEPGPAIAAGEVGTMFVLFLRSHMDKSVRSAVWADGKFFEVRNTLSWRDVFGKTHTQEFVVHPIRDDVTPIIDGERRGEMTAYNHAREQTEDGSET
jgi:hypothetical protein